MSGLPSRQRGGGITRGEAVRLALAGAVALAGCAWALSSLVAGNTFTAAMRFILACVIAEVLAPRRRRSNN